MSDQHTTSTPAYDDPDLDWEYEDEPDDAPPPRPRRKLLTPVSGGLAAIALLAGGFVAGVQVQKGQEDGGASGGGARAGGFPGAANLGARGQSNATGQGRAASASDATVGTVANVKGTTLYVTGADGTTVKIRTNDNSTVTRNADASIASVHPGDSVVIQGAENDNGTVNATSITATAKGVSAFGGLGALAGGGTTRPGGGAGGSSGGAAGGASGVPEGFAPPQG